jgi:hypothetical protein
MVACEDETLNARQLLKTVWTAQASTMIAGGTTSTASACSTNGAPDRAAPLASGRASVTA